MIIIPFDNVPFIGRYTTSKHFYVGTGYKGTGMTYGTVAAMILADELTGKKSPYADVYSLSRIELPGAVDFLKAQADIVKMFTEERLQKPKDREDKAGQIRPVRGERPQGSGIQGRNRQGTCRVAPVHPHGLLR